jgi:hypothetical protein
MIRAACLCGANRMTAPGPGGPVTVCHCRQCRALSGYAAASIDLDESSVTWAARDWTTYVTPGGGVRAFCPTCGTKLWFRAADGAFAVEAGWLDPGSGAHLAAHTYTAAAPDWDRPTDDLPRYPKDET